jgi:hypothetical protein
MPRKPRLPAVIRDEQKKQRIEMAALAAYQMEQGTYAYPSGVRRGNKNEDGIHGWNKAELQRVFGHQHATHPEQLFDDPHFMRMVEYHRWRGADPMFRKKIQNQIWTEVADEISIQIFERVKFHPDSLSYDQKLKTMKLIIDAGVRLGSKKSREHTNELLSGMKPDERKVLIEEQKQNAEKALTDLNAMAAALEGADYVEGELED